MAKGKKYTGIVLEDNTLKIAIVRVADKKLSLVKLDKYTLLTSLDTIKESNESEDAFSGMEADLSDTDVFDLDLDSALDEDVLNLDDVDLDLDSDDDLELELEELEQNEEIVDIDTDLVDESEAPASNELLLYNILSSVDPKKINVALNIPAGGAIYQILKDVDFNDLKKKDLQIIVDDRLESLYGSPRGEDFYSYGVRDDGALLLSSIDEEPQLISLVDRTQSLYRGKLFIEEVLPDETILLGLIKANYELEEGEITCLIQFSESNCRVIFLRGNRLWLVSPVITEGTASKKFLNTVFSKILFQLDTGEVPSLDRLIICNNSLHETSINFFEERFPGIEVSEFSFSEDFFDPGDYTSESLAPFITAIGTAWSGTNYEKSNFPDISFLPKYVKDRQKIFKLQWHGFLLLVFIMISFPILDFLRQEGDATISGLENEISIVDTQLESFTPTVNNYNRISSQLAQIQDKLDLLNTLSENSITWSVNLNLLNEGVNEIGSIWLTSVAPGEEPNTLEIQGISRYRSRIPLVAELFADATLLDVTSIDIRGAEVYSFNYTVNKIIEDETLYTPKSVQGLQNLVEE